MQYRKDISQLKNNKSSLSLLEFVGHLVYIAKTCKCTLDIPILKNEKIGQSFFCSLDLYNCLHSHNDVQTFSHNDCKFYNEKLMVV